MADLRPPLFSNLREILRSEYQTLSHDPHPIETIMQFDKGYYFLPMFYTLCKHHWFNSDWFAGQLVKFLDREFHSLLNTLKRIDPQIIQYAIRDISLNTLHFCANNVSMQISKSISNPDDTFKFIAKNNKRVILHVTSNDQMIQLIRKLQSRYLPIQRFETCKNPCIWNVSTESWQEIQSSGEIAELINNLWYPIRQILEEKNDPNRLIDGFNSMAVLDAITSDTEQSLKELDPHKCLLRLHDGSVLDLLTGHAGGVVPELFVSDLKLLNIKIPRKQMIELCCCSYNNYPPLRRLYETLTSREFFSLYAKVLHPTENVFEVFRSKLTREYNFVETTPFLNSMLHFYVNLCKWTCFDYELLMLLLNHLSRVFAGTNNERQIIVLQGTWSNGKTELFKLMELVLGGYYHSIQSRYSKPPELSLYRMITSQGFENCGGSLKNLFNLYKKYSTTCRMFVTTNYYYHESKASEVFKEKAVVIPFSALFMHNNERLTYFKQNRQHVYLSEPRVVEDSLEGCFFMLYYHLKKQFYLGNA